MIRGTSIFHRNVQALLDGFTLLINYGGSRSSKTYSIIQLLVFLATRYKGLIVVLVARSYPKMKRTLVRDFREIMGDSYDPKRMNKSDFTYTFDNETVFYFMSADNPDDFVGIKSDYALLDEVNTYRAGREIYLHLDTRNARGIFMSFNPFAKFWVTDYWDAQTTKVLHSTYLDNLENLPAKVIHTLETRGETDPNWHRVYTLGEWGNLEGLILEEGTNWWVDDRDWPDADTPVEWRIYGIDFGFSVSKTALTEIILQEGQVRVRLLMYDTGLTSQDIGGRMKQMGITSSPKIIGDSASPMTIEELWRMGFNIEASDKGQDSVARGIDLLKQHPMAIHHESTELINECRNWSYKVDRTGEMTGKPDKDRFDAHALDGIRYALVHKFGQFSGGLYVGGVL